MPDPLHHRLLGAAAAFAVLVGGTAACGSGGAQPDRTASPSTSTEVPAPQVSPAANGWVAFTSGERMPFPWATGGDVHLVREGHQPRRVAGSDTDMSDQGCPAFSPDGGRLAFGQATLSWDSGEQSYEPDAELVLVDVAADGTTSDRTRIPIAGLAAVPCPLWSPDGRWLAFAAGQEVHLVDTITEEQRRLAVHAATDLEWRPGSDDLAIAAEGIHLYSASTGEERSLDLEGADRLTWSPDGSTVAFTRDDSGVSLWVADADGTDPRQLTEGDIVLAGIGPVWSPDGRLIAFERSISVGEASVGVLVTATADADSPFGTETVIEPPTTPGIDGQVTWTHPRSITWSPDGSTLLYVSQNDACGLVMNRDCLAQGGGSFAGVLAVPVDRTRPPYVLADPSWTVGSGGPQGWGHRPPG